MQFIKGTKAMLLSVMVLSYKERMHPKVSRAEIEIFKSLSMAGLTNGMVTQQQIILKSTIPDFCWMEKRKIIYLDGIPVHKKDKAIERDEEITDLLIAQGWDVLRIPYNPPLTDKGLQEIMVTIKRFLNVDEEEME
jgi:very-short-patch-repair endonuclease